jgi:hypothetical protein
MVGGIDYTHAPASADAADNTDAALEQGGIFFSDDRTFNGATDRSMPVIRVWTLVGRVTAIASRTASAVPPSRSTSSIRSTSPTSTTHPADAICEEFPCMTL